MCLFVMTSSDKNRGEWRKNLTYVHRTDRSVILRINILHSDVAFLWPFTQNTNIFSFFPYIEMPVRKPPPDPFLTHSESLFFLSKSQIIQPSH